MANNPYKFRGPNTWALAREAYLSGETAESVARRFDLTVSSMRRRMRLEGWSRRDHAAALDPATPRRAPGPSAPRLDGTTRPAGPPALGAQGDDRPAGPPPDGRAAPGAAETTAAELLRRALRQASEALDAGRTADARALSQMAESLSRTAAREPKTSLETILRAVCDPVFRGELFRIDLDASDDPDLPVKRAYWASRA